MHRPNNYMALCQLHLGTSEAMALIDRMKEYWHQELKLNRPAIGQREGSKTYPCRCNWRTAATRASTI